MFINFFCTVIRLFVCVFVLSMHKYDGIMHALTHGSSFDIQLVSLIPRTVKNFEFSAGPAVDIDHARVC